MSDADYKQKLEELKKGLGMSSPVAAPEHTPEEIRALRGDLLAQYKELARQRIVLDADLLKIQNACPHENKGSHHIYYADEHWTECDDCGKTW